MELIITCNGEHVNTHCSTLGHCNDRLSDKGVLDSLRLAQALKKEKIDFIFCSDIGFRRTTTDLVFDFRSSLIQELEKNEQKSARSSPEKRLKIRQEIIQSK